MVAEKFVSVGKRVASSVAEKVETVVSAITSFIVKISPILVAFAFFLPVLEAIAAVFYPPLVHVATALSWVVSFVLAIPYLWKYKFRDVSTIFAIEAKEFVRQVAEDPSKWKEFLFERLKSAGDRLDKLRKKSDEEERTERISLALKLLAASLVSYVLLTAAAQSWLEIGAIVVFGGSAIAVMYVSSTIRDKFGLPLVGAIVFLLRSNNPLMWVRKMQCSVNSPVRFDDKLLLLFSVLMGVLESRVSTKFGHPGTVHLLRSLITLPLVLLCAYSHDFSTTIPLRHLSLATFMYVLHDLFAEQREALIMTAGSEAAVQGKIFAESPPTSVSLEDISKFAKSCVLKLVPFVRGQRTVELLPNQHTLLVLSLVRLASATFILVRMLENCGPLLCAPALFIVRYDDVVVLLKIAEALLRCNRAILPLEKAADRAQFCFLRTLKLPTLAAIADPVPKVASTQEKDRAAQIIDENEVAGCEKELVDTRREIIDEATARELQQQEYLKERGGANLSFSEPSPSKVIAADRAPEAKASSPDRET